MADPILEALNRAPQEITEDDLDKIIKYLRESRASFMAGVKPKKEGSDIDLVAKLGIKPETGKMIRRV
jgi:hypothetical protein